MNCLRRVRPAISIACPTNTISSPKPRAVARARMRARDCLSRVLEKNWCPETESNCRHTPFQGVALPTELSGHAKEFGCKKMFPRTIRGFCKTLGRIVRFTHLRRASNPCLCRILLHWAVLEPHPCFANAFFYSPSPRWPPPPSPT